MMDFVPIVEQRDFHRVRIMRIAEAARRMHQDNARFAAGVGIQLSNRLARRILRVGPQQSREGIAQDRSGIARINQLRRVDRRAALPVA